MAETNFEEAVGKFVKNTEGVSEPAEEKKTVKQKESIADKFARESREMAANRPTLKEEQQARIEEIKAEQRSIGMGFIEIPIKDLPSGGIFYPEGVRIHVRAASGGDIRHWSMIDETSLLAIDDAINYILERCVTISFPNRQASWKDLVEIDRVYLVLACRDFTFTEGKNELKIAISETEDVTVKKDNITFIDLPEGIYKYYNEEKRCFVFDRADGKTKLNIYMPTVGISQWIRNYVERKNALQEKYDEDFIQVAPMLIEDWRKLNDKAYADFIYDSMSWTTHDWSLISKLKTTMQKAVTPKLVYIDENGSEKEVPLNFRGGIKSIFTYRLDEELGF
jgi:hypothetical protein